MMPNMDGIETMHLLRIMPGYADVPIVVVTANAISGMKEAYLTEGFSDYLSKPIDLQAADAILSKFTPAELKQLPSITRTQNTAEIDSEILQHIYAEGDAKIVQLTALVEAQDFKNYTIQVHALKSVAALIGYTELSEQAKAHEQAGKEGRIGYILQNFSALINSYKQLLEDLSHRFTTPSQAPTSSTDLQNASFDEIQQLFSRIRGAVDDYDLDMVSQLITEAKHIHLAPKQAGVIGSMQEAVDNFDYDRLAELMENLKV